MSQKMFRVQNHKLSGNEASSRTIRRITLNVEAIKALKIASGDVVCLVNKPCTEVKAFGVGIAWPSQEVPQDVVLVSASLLLTANLESGQPALIVALSKNSRHGLPSLLDIQHASLVRLKEITHDMTPVKSREKGSRSDWLTLLLKETLVDLKYITPSQIVEVEFEGQLRRFSVSSALKTSHRHSGNDPTALAIEVDKLFLSSSCCWTVGWETNVALEADVSAVSQLKVAKSVETPTDAYAGVGGLDKQIRQIRDLLEIPLTRPELFLHLGLKPPKGILLHGPPGTGKTHLARAVASSTKSSVLIINGPELSSAYHGETESKLREVFREAKEKSPCIVVLDEVDALVPRREEAAGGEVEKRVVATLLTILDGVEDASNERVVVIGTTNRPNAIDPALRRPGRFDREIEIGVPDAEARFSILKVLLSKTPHLISPRDLQDVAFRAHGYVGADLSAVVREAGTTAIKRWMVDNPSISSDDLPTLTLPDLEAALPTVRPSALRSVFLETPVIRFSDIGGQDDAIQNLKQLVEWPLLHPEAFKRLGVKPPKGVLLYGPPGCSKTILVRACACESGINFVAVKGPELLSKYVGESERAVREMFRKARAASPSILFFDEIDALAGSRASDTLTGSHEGVLTSLLNEMDGVQELLGVTVVAATNRPEAIDSALIRPGRLDRILYVGPPDLEGRIEILKIRMKEMSIGEDVDVVEIANWTEGCSGAEITAMCQEAAMLTMQADMNSAFVPHEAFLSASKKAKRQITKEVIQRYETWRKSSGIAIE